MWMLNLLVIGLFKDIYCYKKLIVDKVALGNFLSIITFSLVSITPHLLHTQLIHR
jgi:hypothetical protein